jgi:hypothetical protein
MPDQAALFADRRHDSGGKVRIAAIEHRANA